MKRRALTFGVILAAFALLIVGIRGSHADDSGTTGRYKTVDIEATQYVWQLISNRDGRVVCQVAVDHVNRPTYDETIQLCGDQIFPSGPLPTPYGTPASTATPTPKAISTAAPTQAAFDLAEFFRGVSWLFVESNEINRQVKVPMPEMIVNFSLPPNQQAPFYVIIAAYEPVYDQKITSISGRLNDWDFTCASARCQVPIDKSGVLEFWATSSLGDESRHSQAALSVVTKEKTTTLELISLEPIILFQDSCAVTWGKPSINLPGWAKFPSTPADLHTQKPYQYLAGQLLFYGLTQAKDCPGSGLLASGAPNSCGLEKTTAAVVEWQNQFDVSIWESGRSAGIPPRLIKALIEQESQFWPGNSRLNAYEYGLGQISQAGVDAALRWDNDLFNNVCSGLFYDCSKVYGRLPAWMQATLRGSLMNSINAECPTCVNGMDLSRAHNSIPVITRTLRSNCSQVQYLMDQRDETASYEDLWHYTFVSYHSGYECLARAMDVALYNDEPADWEHISEFLACPGSVEYVNSVWKSITEFDKYRIKEPETALVSAQATFAPTQAPTRTPTPVRSLSHIRVLVYVDSNGNNYPDPGERVDDIKIAAALPNGQVITSITEHGEAVIDLTGQPVDQEVMVTLSDLYRSIKVRTMRDGEIPVIFRLEKPVVPPALP